MTTRNPNSLFKPKSVMVLAENGAMLHMCEKLGFGCRRELGEPGVVHVSKRLEASR